MKSVAVKLAVRVKIAPSFHRRKNVKILGLGCKRSLVQIQSRRPIYLLDFSRESLSKQLKSIKSISAHTCSKMKAKEWVCGGKIGGTATLQFIRFYLERALAKTKAFLILSHQRINKTLFSTGLRSRGRTMGNKVFYKITVSNWEKYNGNLKKGHKSILLSTGFLDDAKIKMLCRGGKLLYLGLLLSCGDVTSNSVECSHDVLVTFAGGRGVVVSTLLDQLQELQLVTYEKITPFLNRIEKNRKEEKVKEKKLRKGEEVSKTASLLPLEEPVGKVLMAHYCVLWKTRYGTNPTVQKHHPKMLKEVGEQNGKDRTLALLDAYFQAPDSWFIKKGHDLQTFVSSLAPLTSFLESGKMVSNSEIRQMDSAVSSMNTLDALRRGEI